MLDLGEMVRPHASAVDGPVGEVVQVACGSCTGSVFRLALDDDDDAADERSAGGVACASAPVAKCIHNYGRLAAQVDG